MREISTEVGLTVVADMKSRRCLAYIYVDNASLIDNRLDRIHVAFLIQCDGAAVSVK